jgi:alpha-D-xyloside xylohydrolase
MYSFWPEVQPASAEYQVLTKAGCLINPDLGGLAFDATIPECRNLVWSTMLKPRYYDQGVDAYWLDETDGEGTAGGGDGDYGYNTSYGPAASYSNLWVNEWLSMFSDPVAAQPGQVAPPLVLTRGVWAGGQRHGIVLWSSDIHSSFEQLASQVPQGVHASMSGIPWW